MTTGKARVRLDFNPNNYPLVDALKAQTAVLIDLCEELKPLDVRLAALAQTAYEEACMWAVKAATTGPQASGATRPIRPDDPTI